MAEGKGLPRVWQVAQEILDLSWISATVSAKNLII